MAASSAEDTIQVMYNVYNEALSKRAQEKPLCKKYISQGRRHLNGISITMVSQLKDREQKQNISFVSVKQKISTTTRVDFSSGGCPAANLSKMLCA